MDRGFLFADGVYEVVPVFGRKLHFLDLHLDRINSNLEVIGISYRCRYQEWRAILTHLAGLNGYSNQGLYMQVTRGVSDRIHAPPADLKATVFAMSCPIRQVDYLRGVDVIVREDTRWQRCNIKTIGLLPNVLFREEARQAGAFETILTRDGYVTEGAAANVFTVQSGSVRTPVRNERILPGITRQIILDLMRKNGVACAEVPISQSSLYDADEIWLSSSTLDVAPVVRIDLHVVGKGVPGGTWKLVNDLYQRYKEENAESIGCVHQVNEDLIA